MADKIEAAGLIEDEDERQLRAKIAERLVGEARSRVTAANRTLLALLLLILWSWLANLSWIDLSGGKLGTQNRRIEEVKNATNHLEQRCVDRPGKPPRSVEDPKAAATQCRQGIKELKETFGRLNSSFDLLLIKLPDVHLKFHPLLLVVLVSFAIAYASWTRFKILGHLSEAVRIYREELGWTGRLSGRLLPATPFWLWPLSSSSGGSLSREDCADYLGLTGADRWRPILTNVAVVVLLLVTIHIFHVQSSLSGDVLGYDPAQIDRNWKNSSFSMEEKVELKKLHSPLSFTGSKTLDIAGLLALLSPALFLLALGPSVGDMAGFRRRTLEEPSSELPRFSRRNLFLVGGTLAAIAAVVPAGSWNLSAWLKPVFGRSPRFRKKAMSAVTSLPSGLYQRRAGRPAPSANAAVGPAPANPPAIGSAGVRSTLPRQAGLYHFVRTDRTIGGIIQAINPERFTPASGLRAFAQGELASASRFEILERQAVALVRAGGVRAALDRLWSAVIGGSGRFADPTNDLRLYDLIAGLALRYGQRGDLERLIGLTRAQLSAPLPPRANKKQRRVRERLPGRIASWSSPQGEWARRWLAPAKEWRGFDLPPPPTDNR